MSRLCLLLTMLAMVAAIPAARAAAQDGSSGPIQLRYDHHSFNPLTVDVPAGRPLIIKVMNDSRETIEFESFKLNRERAIEPGQAISVRIPALSSGKYDFYDDFHQDVPQGTIVAR
jgi:hypothetical protein